MSKTINVHFQAPSTFTFTTSGGNETKGTVNVETGETKVIKYPLTATEGWYYSKARIRNIDSNNEIILVHTVGKHGSYTASDKSFTVTMPDDFTKNSLTIVVDNSNSKNEVNLSVELVVTDGSDEQTSPDPQIVLPPQQPKI